MKKNGLVVKIGNIDLRVSMDENVKKPCGFCVPYQKSEFSCVSEFG